MIIGHKSKIDDLKGLIANNHLGHGYIFFGSSMVGKRTVATGLGNFLENKTFDLPVGDEVLQDTKIIDVDFMRTINPDTKDSIGIDAVREIKNFLWQKPNVSSRRTLIIDNAELLTTQAQNALLKITEEPPVSSLLILVTSDIESILPTIVSRLPKIYFGAVPESDIAKWSNVKVAKRALGKPGLAWRLANDEAFAQSLTTAEAFLKTTPAGRRDFIKKVIEPDDFSLRNFLDAVIITLAWEKPSKTKAAFWHKTLRLYENANNFGLNPRLQLEALMK
jgi:replication-associated recombination protein RarA